MAFLLSLRFQDEKKAAKVEPPAASARYSLS